MKVHPTGTTYSGVAGTAAELQPIILETDRPDIAGTLSIWFLTCPEQSPAWEHYVLVIIHLRDIPNVAPANLRFPEATHELMLFACDPEDNPVLEDVDSWTPLHPINLVDQVELPSDESAIELLRLSARAVVDGMLWAEPPLSHQREPWQTALRDTAEHLRGDH